MRRQHGKMAAPPKRDDIFDVSKPGDSRPLAPFPRLFNLNGGGVGWIGIAGNDQVYIVTLFSQNAVGGYQRPNSFVG